VEQRLDLAGGVAVAGTQGDVQAAVQPAGSHRDGDVLHVVGGDGGEGTRGADRQSPQRPVVGSVADHDGQAPILRPSDVLGVRVLLDGDDRHTQVPQQLAQPLPDLTEPDHDDVVASRYR
jgi:hypothetical protein